MTPFILAHRGNLSGPVSSDTENTLPHLIRALESGYSLETDFRADDGRLVLSHDEARWSPERDALSLLDIMVEFDGRTGGGHFMHAFNVKDEPGLELLLQALDRRPTLHASCFLFDFELAFPNDVAARLQDAAARHAQVAWRASDREPNLETLLRAGRQIFWLDEFTRVYASGARVQQVSDVGGRAFCVSGDLHGSNHLPSLRTRWREWRDTSAAGICTDFADDAARTMEDQ